MFTNSLKGIGNSIARISPKTTIYIIEFSAALITLLFLYTALSKLINFDDFYGQINNQPFDNRLTPLFVYGLPASEILAISLLLFNRTRLWGFTLSFLMMLAFTGYIVLVLSNFYNRVPCSCGGVINHFTWAQHLWFNIAFIIISGTGLLFETVRRQNLPSSYRPVMG